jgi:hypothetical protein
VGAGFAEHSAHAEKARPADEVTRRREHLRFVADIAAGALEVVLADHELPAVPVYALHAQARQPTVKIRTFVEFVPSCSDGRRMRDAAT